MVEKYTGTTEEKALLKQIHQRQYFAIALGFLLPIVLEGIFYFWLHRYLSKGALQAIEMTFIGIVGGVFVYLIAHGTAKELQKYVPDATNKNIGATILKLQALDNPKAWWVFHCSNLFAAGYVFFAIWATGLAACAFFEYSIYPLLGN